MTSSQRRPKRQKEVKIMKRQFTIKKRILIMRHSKIVSAAIALSMIAFFTMGSVPSVSATPRPTPVTITAVFDFSTFPDVTGTFTTSGALTISGPSTMHVELLNNGTPGQPAHCVVTLLAPNGTIIIDQQCQFATSPPRGRWEIVSGTGAYANLNGNGPLTMPPNTEAMTGFIYP